MVGEGAGKAFGRDFGLGVWYDEQHQDSLCYKEKERFGCCQDLLKR